MPTKKTRPKIKRNIIYSKRKCFQKLTKSSMGRGEPLKLPSAPTIITLPWLGPIDHHSLTTMESVQRIRYCGRSSTWSTFTLHFKLEIEPINFKTRFFSFPSSQPFERFCFMVNDLRSVGV
jgi:hypothetical protein